MKIKIIYILLSLFVFGCSKKPAEINGMPQKEDVDPSPALPFEVTRVWPDAETTAFNDFKNQVAALIDAKDYQALDKMATQYRSSKEQYPNGSWKLGGFYSGFIPSRELPDAEWEARLDKLRDWIAAKPDSITARVVLAYVLVDYAWKARGNGYANTVMPRWSGGEDEMEKFLEDSADKIGGDEGDMLYAQVVWNIHACSSSDNVFKENGFSWQRVNRGFKIIEKHFPDSLQVISEHAYLAAYAGDAATTREYLKKTEGRADLAIFYHEPEYIRVANWAFAK